MQKMASNTNTSHVGHHGNGSFFTAHQDPPNRDILNGKQHIGEGVVKRSNASSVIGNAGGMNLHGDNRPPSKDSMRNYLSSHLDSSWDNITGATSRILHTLGDMTHNEQEAFIQGVKTQIPDGQNDMGTGWGEGPLEWTARIHGGMIHGIQVQSNAELMGEVNRGFAVGYQNVMDLRKKKGSHMFDNIETSRSDLHPLPTDISQAQGGANEKHLENGNKDTHTSSANGVVGTIAKGIISITKPITDPIEHMTNIMTGTSDDRHVKSTDNKNIIDGFTTNKEDNMSDHTPMILFGLLIIGTIYIYNK